MNLDTLSDIENLDNSNVRGSIRVLAQQISDSWETTTKHSLPDSIKSCTKIVFSGMGGSGLGASVIKHMYGRTMPIPFEIVNDYTLPAYVDSQTLVVVQSYSGTTEESISCYKQAIEKTKNVITIATGEKLQELAEEHNTTHITIVPKYNPSNQPRMAIGYSVMIFITILHMSGFVTVTEEELEDINSILTTQESHFGLDSSTDNNLAKKLAFTFYDRIPVIVASEHLLGAIHAIRNQIHENAKNFADIYPIPELDHHLLEALPFPKSLIDHDCYFFLHSKHYSERNAKRMLITQDIVANSGHTTEEYTLKAKTKLGEVFETIQIGAYIGFYLSMLNGVDPAPIPHVEELKKELA